MLPIDFLSTLLPVGLIVIATPAKSGFFQTVHETFESAANEALRISKAGKNCYFGLGSLKAKELWNADWKNSKGEKIGKMEIRVGANIAQLKSFFVDIDIDPNNPKKYGSCDEALEALDTLCSDTAFPAPMVVSSGGGLHCYWPFSKAVSVDAWRPAAVAFKQSLQALQLKFDPARTSDASSVLRMAGTFNYKYDPPGAVEVIREAEATHPSDMFQYILQLAEVCKVAPPKPPEAASPFDAVGGNLEKQYPLSKFGPIIKNCAQLQHVMVDGGLTSGEPAWYGALGVARLCEDSERAALFLSDRYPNFDRSEMDKRLSNLESQSTGPTLCTTFDVRCPGLCGTCPNWGKVTSPIVLGHTQAIPVEAAQPTIEIENEETGETAILVLPNPPWPYMRREGGGIVGRVPAPKGGEETFDTIYEHDMYPMRRMVNERRDAEETVWRVRIPIVGWTEMVVPQSALAMESDLNRLLLNKGVYVKPSKIKSMVAFMVAYISQLQKESKTENLFGRMGWRDDFKLFVLDDCLYRPKGVVEHHQVSHELRDELPGMQRKGTLEGWKEAIQFYNAPGHMAHRFMLYGAFGSPLFHMTGHHGAIVNAYGVTGSGKTRTLHAINSIWGHPEELGTSGTASGSTTNARYSLLNIYNNLPFCFDEITRLEPKDFGDLALAVSQGKGKRRNTRAGQLSKIIESWSLLMYTSANTDAYISLMQNRRDATAEAMRVLQIPFSLPGVYTQVQADTSYQQGIMQNYGHAGHLFVPYIVDKYDKICETMHTMVERTAERGKMSIAERFQSGVIASHIVGAMIARKLGLLEGFPIEQDWAWAIDQIAGVRAAIQEHHASPKEILSEFLEARVGETLVISQTMGVNIAPRVDQAPRGALSVRHEVDTKLIFLLKNEFKRYCIDTGANYGAIQDTLICEGVLLDHDAKRVLGAGTDFGKGQVRCWMIDVKKLQQ